MIAYVSALKQTPVVCIRGGGDLASGVTLRLHRSGLRVIISELAQPLAVRRSVAFAEAVYSGSTTVEGCTAHRVNPADTDLASQIMAERQIPVLIDPDGEFLARFRPDVLVDARMIKQRVTSARYPVGLSIGLGPGFVAGENCDAVIETNRGFSMGRVIWQGSAESNTSIPEEVAGQRSERVLRAPADGTVIAHAEIGDHIESGQIVAEVGGRPVTAAFKGILRGLIHPGLNISRNMKIGDIDPRDDDRICRQVSDKSLAVGGGVLEAICSKFRFFET